MTELVLIDIKSDGVALATLNRPEVMNAFNEAAIAAVTAAFQALGADPAVRVIVLRGAGKAFCAGGDLDWMRRTADYDYDANFADAYGLATMLRAVNDCPKPTIAAVQGAAFGGGVGLVAACDIAIASDKALFSLSEARLGLIPATIGPYVLAAIGPRACRRYFLTAERFDAAEALRIGLVHQAVPPDQLDEAVEAMIAKLREAGPQAQAACKALIRDLMGRGLDDALMRDTAGRIAAIRASDEGREGIAAFLGKREPNWRS